MTHTAGMTVHGFPGYAAGAPVPTLVQVLNGEKPANTPPIRIETPPEHEMELLGRRHHDHAAAHDRRLARAVPHSCCTTLFSRPSA